MSNLKLVLFIILSLIITLVNAQSNNSENPKEEGLNKSMSQNDSLKFHKEFSGYVNPNGGNYIESGRQFNKFDFGIEGSPSLISLRGNDAIKNYHKSTLGFLGGLFFQINLKKIISMRTNLSYERKGSVASIQQYNFNQFNYEKISIRSKFDYLTIPILLRASIGKKLKYTFNAGPYFGCLIKETYAIKYGENLEKKETNTFLNKFDFGLSTGIGIVIPIKFKFEFSCELRDDLGLYNISSIPIINDGSIKTNSLKLLFGIAYKFGFKNLSKV